ADLAHEVEQAVAADPVVVADQAHRDGGGRGPQHLLLAVEDEGRRPQQRHGGVQVRSDGGGRCRRDGLLTVLGESPDVGDDRAEQHAGGADQDLGDLHASIVGCRSSADDAPDRFAATPSADVHRTFTARRRPFTARSYGRVMRHQYYEQLDRIIDDLVRVTDRVRRSVGEATSALLDTDVPTAERVISAGGDIETAVDEIEERALVLLATQQPVATDLRQLVATLRMVADL